MSRILSRALMRPVLCSALEALIWRWQLVVPAGHSLSYTLWSTLHPSNESRE